jgi:cytoskeletal protein CcmA (bactofilin family)
MFGNNKNNLTSQYPQDKKMELPSVVKYAADKKRGAVAASFENPILESEAEPSMLSAGSAFSGALVSPGPVHALGKLKGELESPHVTLGVSGHISGLLKCKKLIIDGKFDGDLVCEEAVAGATAILEGTLAFKSIQVSLGAVINGKVEIGKR